MRRFHLSRNPDEVFTGINTIPLEKRIEWLQKIFRSINAHSNTSDGIRMMRHPGFTETVPKAPGLHDFVIDVERSGIPFIMKYKEELKKWQEEQKTKKLANVQTS